MPGQFLCMGMGRRKARPSAMHDNYLDESPVQANLADDSNLPQCNVKSIGQTLAGAGRIQRTAKSKVAADNSELLFHRNEGARWFKTRRSETAVIKTGCRQMPACR